MSARVEAAVRQLRRFRPEGAEALDRLAAAADVLELALDVLRRTGDPAFAVSAGDTVVDLHGHVTHSRVLGDAFEEAATRFERTQDASKAVAPRVFGDHPAGFMGPVPPSKASGHGSLDATAQHWLAEHLAAASGRTPSDAVRAMEANYRLRLGLFDGPPYVLAVHEHRLWLSGSAGVGAMSVGGGIEQDWTIVELSDGSALATVSSQRKAEGSLGGGGGAEVFIGDRHLGLDQQGALTVGAVTSQTRTKHFASPEAANRAMAQGDLDGFDLAVVGTLAAVAPGLGVLGKLVIDRRPDAMDDAPRTSRAVQVTAGAKLANGVSVGSVATGRPLGAGGQITLLEQRDREAATTTDVLGLSASLSSTVAALLSMVPAATAASVAVTRQDGSGAAQTLTVRLAFDAAAGLQPRLDAAASLGGLPAAPTASGGASSGTGASVAADPAPTHRYEITVDVDLTDPANRSLAEGLSTTGTPSGRIDEDLRAVARATDLDGTVLARSHVTVLEQAISPSHDVEVDGPVVGGGSVVTDSVTVGAWHNVGGQMRPM